MRNIVVAGNWKMNTHREEATSLIDGVLREAGNFGGVDVVLFPPYLFLDMAVQKCRKSGIGVGAQNAFYKKRGAYTGEISPVMLRDIGCDYVILGHSERRHYFDETNAIINKKMKSCLEAGLTPVLCIGETLTQRQQGKTFDILNDQIVYGLEGIDGSFIKKTIIAYEPVWAIGTGISASITKAQEAHEYIRKTIESFTDTEAAGQIRILYGGSVNTKNARELLEEDDIDGALVGGASLKPESFCEIVKSGKATSQPILGRTGYQR